MSPWTHGSTHTARHKHWRTVDPTSNTLAESAITMTSEHLALSFPLGQAERGFCGVITAVGASANSTDRMQDDFNEELERRLLEIGFVEGARIEILHEGLIGGDPIAVRVDDMNVALRRREANAILVRALPLNAQAKVEG